MARELHITDPGFVKKDKLPPWDALAMRLIRDERDLPFMHLIAQMSVVLGVGATSLFALDDVPLWAAPIYWAVLFGAFFDRYILMLHNTSHRKLFKKELELLNSYIPWVLGPLAGQTPETYYAHHVGMHHAEGNLAGDLSTTMPFARDSLLHFLQYWGRFFLIGIIELPLYHLRNKNPKHVRRTVVGEACWYSLVIGLGFVSLKATLIVFVVPLVLARFLMMAGNWAQHAFIDPDDPANDFKSSITTINTRYNRRCFNDGYHIGHHEMAARHWTDMPRDFEKKRDKYRDEGAIVFEGVDYFMIWFNLMLKRYDWLADKFVDLEDEPRSKDDIVALLRSRTRPVPFPAVPTASN